MLFLHLCIATCYLNIILSNSVSHYILVIYDPHCHLRCIGGIHGIIDEMEVYIHLFLKSSRSSRFVRGEMLLVTH